MVSRRLATGHEQLAGVVFKREARSNQVSFKKLYHSVLALQPTEGDHCPACDTSLAGEVHVVTNPYDKATYGLSQLKELGDLQAKSGALGVFLEADFAEYSTVEIGILTAQRELDSEAQSASARLRRARYQCYPRRSEVEDKKSIGTTA